MVEWLEIANGVREEGSMEQEVDKREPRAADVTNAQSWLAVGVAVGSGVGVALGRIALGVGLGLALGAIGAALSRIGNSDGAVEE
jgi:uncharacterized membrane protein